jgi:hypothetical protein
LAISIYRWDALPSKRSSAIEPKRYGPAVLELEGPGETGERQSLKILGYVFIGFFSCYSLFITPLQKAGRKFVIICVQKRIVFA